MRFSEKLCHLLQLSPRFLIAMVVLIAVAGQGQGQINSVPKIYYNGNIITYDQTDGPEESETVKAIGVSPDGKISFIGTLEYVEERMKKANPSGNWKINLEGKTLIPGFFDGHSHFVQVAYLPMFADLLPPPDGPVTSIEEIKESLIKHRKNKELKVNIKGKGGNDKEWEVVLGNGYDDSRLTNKSHPTRRDLDDVSDVLGGKGNRDILVCIFHQSGHYSVCNSAALSAAGYYDETSETKATLDPEGGTIYRDDKAPHNMTGLLGEKAHINMLLTVVPPIGDQDLLAGQDFYTSQGFTTVEDGRVSPDILPRLSGLSKKFSVDLVVYPDLQMVYENRKDGLPEISRTYGWNGHFRTGGVKLTLDGSPQGRSAWLTVPYAKPPADQNKDYLGEGNIKDVKVLKGLLTWAYEKKEWQVLMHANGDAAIDQLIDAEREVQNAIRAERAAKKQAPLVTDRRTVLLHGQFLRANQIQALYDLKVFPSLFPMHTYYWGDWYREIVGKERADFISPTKAVQNAKMMFSIHSDSPVTKPNSMRLLDSAVNRTTRTGVVLGEGQKITPIVALKAMTIWPAYQHFEEKTKGSIEVGKNADFVILSHNPLKVAPQYLICIQILQTIKGGEPVYTNDDTLKNSGEKFAACTSELAR